MTPVSYRRRRPRSIRSLAQWVCGALFIIALGSLTPACSASSSKADQCPLGWGYDLDNDVCIPLSAPKPDLSGGVDGADGSSRDLEPSPDSSTGVDALPGTTTIVALTVRETAGIARVGEVVENGVPLPRSLALTETTRLAVFDATGAPVPAQFRVLARWNAGRDESTAPIQWLLVSFPATVGTSQSAVFTLALSDDPAHHPAPSTPLQLLELGNQVVVDTGVARFAIGSQVNALFTSIRLSPNGATVVGKGEIDATIDGISSKPTTLRKLTIENKGPLRATVVVRTELDRAPIGGGKLALVQRYRFSAGSGTAIVRQALSWEGDLCGNGITSCDGKPNGVLIERFASRLLPPTPGSGTLTILAERGTAPTSVVFDTDSEASLRQLPRSDRHAPRHYELVHPGGTSSGELADAGLIALGRTDATLAVALFQMHRFEPQALRLIAGSGVEIGAVDGPIWLSSRQGLFVRFAISALPPGADTAALERQTFAPLNRPLRAWPSAAWFRTSRSVFEIPTTAQPKDFSDYDAHLRSLLETTRTKRDDEGLWGLMITGLYPRYWSPQNGYEIDCDDATPSSDADNPFWCASWTDYHNTLKTAPIFAMRSGAVEWLDELATTGALRQLHTQIFQCAPDDPDFYCAMAPAGYGAYRSDFNSSHAYFDNLMLYYWLSGDYTVVETLKRGAETMRGFLCPKRPNGNCSADEVNSDPWAEITGRVASQWFAVFRFVGLASDDPSFLVDFRTGLSRAVTQHFVLARSGGEDYGFWTGAIVSGPGTYQTDQTWMATLYDMNNLYRLMLDSDDAPIGEPPIAPSAVLIAWARTLRDFGSGTLGENPVGDGTVDGTWPNILEFEWSGTRIGGTLVTARHTVTASDPDSALYETGKANLPALFLRAALLSGDATLRAMGRDLALLAWQGSKAGLSSGIGLGKIQGLYLARLHAAIALLE